MKARFALIFQSMHKEMMMAQNVEMRQSMFDSLPAVELRNRSFIGASFLAQEQRNYFVVRDVGMSYDVKDAAFTLHTPAPKVDLNQTFTSKDNYNNINNIINMSNISNNNTKRRLAMSSSAALDKNILLSSLHRTKMS